MKYDIEFWTDNKCIAYYTSKYLPNINDEVILSSALFFKANYPTRYLLEKYEKEYANSVFKVVSRIFNYGDGSDTIHLILVKSN